MMVFRSNWLMVMWAAGPFELQKSVNSGTWTAVATALVTSASVVLASSGTVQFRVRGVDLVGNAGAWAYAAERYAEAV